MFSLLAQVSTLPGWIDTIANPWFTTTVPSVTLSCIPAVGTGACELAGLLVYAVRQGKMLVGATAFLIMIVAGFRLVISQSEEALTTARRSILGAVIGLFVIFITEPVVNALYGGFGILPGTVLDPANIPVAVGILSAELSGILQWGEALVAIVAIGLLIVQAVYVLGSFGAEETIRKAYRAVFSSIFGILLIVFDQAITAIFGIGSIPFLGGPTTVPFFVEVFGMLRFLLAFVAIIVIAVIIYAGGLMLLHYGNEEILNKGKTILLNAALGLLLISVSFVIVSTVILGIT